jgi:Amt family ammonium transporter
VGNCASLQNKTIGSQLTVNFRFSVSNTLFQGFGFNPGSALVLTKNTQSLGMIAGRSATNTAIAGAAGALSALVTDLYLIERNTALWIYDLSMALNGLLAGLVSITSSSATVTGWAAVLIGVVGGWLYMLASHVLVILKIDDAVDGIPIHMVCGAWGLISVGFLSTPSHTKAAYGTDEHVGWLYELGRGSVNGTLLRNQLIGILFLVGWVTATMLPFFMLLRYLGWLRSGLLEELVGMDAFMGVTECEEGVVPVISTPSGLPGHTSSMTHRSIMKSSSSNPQPCDGDDIPAALH